MGLRIIGTGGYLPKNVVRNSDIIKKIDSSEEWIFSRTGIMERRISTTEDNLELSYRASLEAVKNSNIDINQIDLIIVATTTNDKVFPSLATRLQAKLLIKNNIPSFDIQAVCSGYIYALHVASYMKSNRYKKILVVGSEKMSSLIDWEDRSTCILFGDGAGAAILEYQENNFGIIDSIIESDGKKEQMLYAKFSNNAANKNIFGRIYMNGNEVFKLAVNYMKDSINKLLESNNISCDDVNFLIPHQANIRIINSLSEKIGINKNKVITTIKTHANSSAASIPLALTEAIKNKQIKEGNIIVLVAFGAGISWGSTLIRW